LMKAIEIDCTDCAHCVDFSDETDGEATELSKARADI
jgi:hypothetical protein